jgi:hypothetical protein
MPSRVYLQLEGVTKLHVIQNGDAVEIDAASGKLNVKDVLGELLGSWREASIVGWSIEREPLNYKSLSTKDIDRILAEMQKREIFSAEEMEQMGFNSLSSGTAQSEGAS